MNYTTMILYYPITDFGVGDLINGTFFGVPLLFHYKEDCNKVYNGSDMSYTFFISTQTSPQPMTLIYETISGGRSIQVQQWFPLGTSYKSFFEMTTNHDTTTSECYACSLTYSCKNNVFGANFMFQGNPTVSVIGIFAGLTFTQSLAMYPVCKEGMKCMQSHRAEQYYYYYVIFGPLYVKDNATYLNGITIQMHQDTEITIQLSGAAHTLNNTVEQVTDGYTIHRNESNTYTTLWIQPKVSSCGDLGNYRSLEDTFVVSNKPLTVYTNRASCSTQFNYDSQVVHQMADAENWGTKFILDTEQSSILPESINMLEHEIAIRTAQNGTTVKLLYYQSNRLLYTNTTTLMKSNVHRIVYSILSNTCSHIFIAASNPVLVLYSIQSRDDRKLRTIILYYSIVLQPVEWFSNKQMIALRHPTQGEVYKYHISVAIAEENYDPNDIYITDDQDMCQATPLYDYNGFTANIRRSNGYVAFYITIEINCTSENDTTDTQQLLLWHRNPQVHLGVTVFAYGSDLQYGYSNGYILGKPYSGY